MFRILITGGAGFIGSAVARHLLSRPDYEVVNLDSLTYAGNTESLRSVVDSSRYHFVRANINDKPKVRRVLADFQPHAVMHLAAETHVDRSIDGPDDFIQTNVAGTAALLMESLNYWQQLSHDRARIFRFHHVSTDEVFGELGATGRFTENSPYRPNSPYAASKAASDHLVWAWARTYGLPVLLSNCSNNYGPFQFPEKLVPLTIIKCLRGESIPVFGNGQNVRDWLFVEDHAIALELILEKGRVGEGYNVGGASERTNLQVVQAICDVLDEVHPRDSGSYSELISFVPDRPGHDFRYAIDFSKIGRELSWRPTTDFGTGIRKTVRWFIENEWWWGPIAAHRYGGERLGRVCADKVAAE